MAFTKLEKVSAWRRVSVGMWGVPDNSTTQGVREVDLSLTLPYLEKLRAETGRKVTLTHLFVAALGRTLKAHPHYNVILRRSRPYQRDTVDIFVQVALKSADGQADLSGVKLRNCDTASLVDIADQVAKRAGKVRAGKDKDIESQKSLLQYVPAMLTRPLIRTLTSLSFDWGVDMRKMGIKPDPFGSAMVTNVGGFGIPHALVPLLPTSRVPMLICLGMVHDRAVVRDGKVVARPMLLMTGSFDHRLFDGFQIAKITIMVDEIVS
ncbi:MAG: pyruvate/2-oxoglutarate dehydrogenase complex dihydrolipoamide acyltransferase (E2) component, partial [Myxococcota bacterium]